jgi:CRISPR-associated protein Cmr5
MKQVEKWIPGAIGVIEADKFVENDKIDKEFKGYFASFGAAIIQSGLLPAVIFFENEQGNAQADRKKVPMAVLHLLQKQYGNEPMSALHTASKLSEYILHSTRPEHKDLEMVAKAAVALKVALRTFNLND